VATPCSNQADQPAPRLAVGPPTTSALRSGHPPGASVLSRTKIAISAPACGLRVASDSLRSLLTAIFLGA
jgi:hypothetical protein